MTASVLLTLLVAVAGYQCCRCHHEYVVYYLNSSNEVSCWMKGIQLPCHNLVQTLKGAQKQFNKSPAKHNFYHYNYLDSDIECPTWMYYSNQTNSCVCGAEHHGAIKCNATLNETYVLDCHQMTFDQTFQRVIAGRSFYGCLNQVNPQDIYHLVPANRSQINEVMCSRFHRDGRLCGACRDGYSPLVYSYQLHCKQCSDAESKYNWAVFAAVAFIPLTVFYAFVVLFKFNANSPHLNAFVFFAQITTNPANIRIMSSGWMFGSLVTYMTKLIATFYGIWNIDYFRTLYPDICLRLTTLQALSLDYIIAFYPLLLIMITYIMIKLHSRECRLVVWMWKPIKKCLLKVKNTDNMKTSMIDVFATFLILSYHKILSVNFDLLAFTAPIDSSGTSVGRFLYYDASYEYFGPDHLPYGILAIISFTFINLLPVLLLFFYPMKWFQRCLNNFKLSHLALHTFVDSFAGCYKDGTEPGTRDCRYFAALFLFLRILLFIIYQATLDVSFYGWSGTLFTLFTILFVMAQPYKSMYSKYNKVTVVVLGILVMTTTAIMNVNIAFIKVHQAVNISAAVVAALIALPQFYAIGIGLKWMYKHCVSKMLRLKNQPLQRSLSESSLLIASEHRTQAYKLLA